MLIHLFVNSIPVLLILANILKHNQQLQAKFTIKDGDTNLYFKHLPDSSI